MPSTPHNDSPTPPNDVTEILIARRRGDIAPPDLLAQIYPLVASELRNIAARLMREQPASHTLQPTALVHEAYLKLVKSDRVEWADRAHFLGVAARAMRHILINHARDLHAAKRGGGWQRITVSEDVAAQAGNVLDLLALDDALTRLAGEDERIAQVVELRVFAGMSVEEVAHVLGVSDRTVKSDWKFARAWLADALSDRPDADARGAP